MLLLRGGASAAATTDVAAVAPASDSKALSIPPPPPSRKKSISTRIQSVNRSTRAWKRKQFWALVALRFGFVLLTPISLVVWILLLAVSVVVHAVWFLTFSLVGGQVRILTSSLAKAGLATVLASLCGILLPVFATFGLVISVLQCGLELTEPLLRMRYQRQLRKIQHLHRLLTGTCI